jgi:hypothetical protein
MAKSQTDEWQILQLDALTAWCAAKAVTDVEFSQLGVLLCTHAPRDLALMVVRLQEQLATITKPAHDSDPRS